MEIKQTIFLLKGIKMKNYALEFLLAILLFSFPSLSNAKTFVYSCDGCSSVRMKDKAQMAGAVRSGYAHVFNETDRIYKKYRLRIVHIEDFIPDVVASEMGSDMNILNAFNSLIDAKNRDLQILESIDFSLVGNNLEPLEQNRSFSNLAEKKRATRQQKSDSNTDELCVSKPTLPNDKLAHDYIKSSTLRRTLFYKINQQINSMDPTGGSITTVMEHQNFITVVQDSSNGVVSTIGDVLGYLELRKMTLHTVDGGFIKGRLNYSTNSFDIHVATDGDCNDLPLVGDDLLGEYDFTQADLAARFDNLTAHFGAVTTITYNPPRRITYRTACTGISGQKFVCSRFCSKRE
jgi:hypothetical protein